jgi:transposase-like protein
METQRFVRQQAVVMYYYHQRAKASICEQLGCSRPTLDRWLSRYDPDDPIASLEDRPSGPKQPTGGWSADIHQQVIEMRRHRTNRNESAYTLIGARAIHYELKALGSREVPPVRTIHQWLAQAGLVSSKTSDDGNNAKEKKPIPLPDANVVNCVHQLDLKGPIYLRGCSHKHYLVVLRDRKSRRCAISALQSRQADGIVAFLVTTWQSMGLPKYLQMDNALEFRGSNRYPRAFGRVVRMALDLDIEPVFNPPSEPWRNGCIERFNGFIEERLLGIEFESFSALINETSVCQNVCNSTHRLKALDGMTPNEYVGDFLPRQLGSHYQRHRLKRLPQNKGYVSFVRLVRKSGRITLGATDRFMVDPQLAWTYVLARVNLAKKRVVILQDDEIIVSYDYSKNTVGAWAGD